jgi:hypothetical protein
MRLQRALANPRASVAQIRAIAAELPTVGLEDALAILLALIDREPQTVPRAAARWGARFTVERKASLADAQLALAALAVLPGPGRPRRRRGPDRALRPLRAASRRRAPPRLAPGPRAG